MSGGIFKIAVRKFGPFESAIQKIWNLYCRKTGCTLELEAVAMDLHPLYDAIITNKGLKNGDWDVTLINTDWITEAVRNGHVENLTPFVEKKSPQGFPQSWPVSLQKMQEFEGQAFGLPFHNGPECLIFRKDLFESEHEKNAFETQFGRSLEVPKTWDELKEVATFFNRPEQNLYGTTFAAYPDGHNTVFDFCLQLWTRGGELLTKKGQVSVNSSEALEGMKYYRSLLQNDQCIHPDSRDFDSVKSGAAFANGELAMMVNWFGFAAACEVQSDSRVKGKVDVANVPSGPGGVGVSLNAYWMYAMGSGCIQKEVAYDFIQFAVNEHNDKLLTLEGGIGCRISTWHDKDVNTEVPYYHKLEELHKNTRALPRMNNWSDIATVIDQLVLEVINTDNDIQGILDAAQSKLSSVELSD